MNDIKLPFSHTGLLSYSSWLTPEASTESVPGPKSKHVYVIGSDKASNDNAAVPVPKKEDSE